MLTKSVHLTIPSLHMHENVLPTGLVADDSDTLNSAWMIYMVNICV